VIHVGRQRYDGPTRAWLQRSDHYLGNAPPGCLFAVGVTRAIQGLFGLDRSDELLGLCLVSRPVARRLPQDGTIGEITRMWLAPGLPYGTASRVLMYAANLGAARGMQALIAYHDRTRHTGCIYKKAGFKKDGTTAPGKGKGWGNRSDRASGEYEATPKRRWRLDLTKRAKVGSEEPGQGLDSPPAQH